MKSSLIFFLIIEIFFIVLTKDWNSLENNCLIYDEDDTASTEEPKTERECTHTQMENGKFCCFAELIKKNDSNTKKKLCIAASSRTPSLSNLGLDSVAENSSKITCPKKSEVTNSCGTIGTLEPVELSECSSITFPEAWCCFVKVRNKNTGRELNACRRITEYPNKKSNNKTIRDEMITEGFDFVSVECSESFLKIAVYLLAFFIIL